MKIKSILTSTFSKCRGHRACSDSSERLSLVFGSSGTYHVPRAKPTENDVKVCKAVWTCLVLSNLVSVKWEFRLPTTSAEADSDRPSATRPSSSSRAPSRISWTVSMCPDECLPSCQEVKKAWGVRSQDQDPVKVENSQVWNFYQLAALVNIS